MDLYIYSPLPPTKHLVVQPAEPAPTAVSDPAHDRNSRMNVASWLRTCVPRQRVETSTLVSLVFNSGRELESGASAELGSHRDEDWETENHDTLHYPFTNHDKVMYTLLHFFLIVREKNKSSGSCRRFMELVDSPCIVLNQAARKGRQSLVQLASMQVGYIALTQNHDNASYTPKPNAQGHITKSPSLTTYRPGKATGSVK